MKRLAFAMLALTGCVGSALPPPPTAKELELPAVYSQPAPDGAPSPEAWWAGLDPHLGPLVEEALARNFDVAAAVARLDAAIAQAKITGADLEPQLAGTIDGGRRKEIFIGIPLPGGDSVSSTSSVFGVGLNVSWELDIWGRIRATIDAAGAEVEASTADVVGVQLSLAGQTSKAWFALSEALAQTDLAVRTVDTRRATERRVRRRYEAGMSSGTDLRLARSNVGAAEALFHTRRRQLDSSRRQLEVLLGRYPAGELEANGKTVPLPPPVPTGVPAELIVRRPDLVATERRLAAAGARVEAARDALLPRISISGGVGTNTGDIDTILDPSNLIWNLAGNLLQPIFQGGRLRGQLELTEAQQRELLAGYRQQILRALREVETALAIERILADEEITLELVVAESAAAWESAERRYTAGIGDYLSVLESQRRSLDAESRLLEIRWLRLTTRVDLHLALGGGLIEAGDHAG